MASKKLRPSAMIKQRVGAKPKAAKTPMPKVGTVKAKKETMPKKMTQEQAQRRALDNLMKKRMATVKKTGVYPNYNTN
jgi:hypothetical protein